MISSADPNLSESSSNSLKIRICRVKDQILYIPYKYQILDINLIKAKWGSYQCIAMPIKKLASVELLYRAKMWTRCCTMRVLCLSKGTKEF